MDNDITVTKNTEGSKVTWTYTRSKPIFRDVPEGNTHHFEHTIAPKALISDIDLDHQIVWSVSNPSGQYTLNVTSHPYVAALVFNSAIRCWILSVPRRPGGCMSLSMR